MSTLAIAGDEQQSIAEFTEKAYLDYSMYVILDRALPHIADGLKPVQRRIVYAMSELGLKSAAKYKKSARTVGDVLGKYHPHGDSACYEAMVLMAQPFSYRYPLVDGQGNWGAPDDPKSFAAMRYTEAKLSPYAEILLAELGQGTVDWVPNFDATLDEPKLLPARLPNVLLNGSTGIAVGMATDIPPHNLNEVTEACIYLLENPKASLNDLFTIFKGPDFPTDAEIITPQEDIKTTYERGTGSIRMRAVYNRENGDIIVTALPHQVSGAKVLEQIAAQMRAKKLPMVADLRDESDHENPVRLVITPRSNRIDADGLMKHLFATTDLERSYRVNLNMIGLDGRPQVKDIKTILQEWLHYRLETVTRRLQYRLDKILSRLHILDGLLIAYLNLDEVIHIIRTQDDPKATLMSRFNLSEKQADAILDTKLRQLAKLEEMKLRAEQDELNEEREDIEKTLGSQTRLKTLVRKELKADLEKYGDERRSPIVEREEAQAISETDMVPAESMTVILSRRGWVRAAKGTDIDGSNLPYRAGDRFLMQANSRSNDMVIFFDSTGRSYCLLTSALPSARGHGEPLTGSLKPPGGAEFVSVHGANTNKYFLIASDAGYGFVMEAEEFLTKNRSGKAILKLPAGSQVLIPQPVHDLQNDLIAAVTNEGRLLLFPLKDLPCLPKGKGNKIINIASNRVVNREEFVVGVAVLTPDQKLVLYSGKRHLTLKQSDLEHYFGERGRRGNKLPRGYQRIDNIAATDD